MNFFLILVDYSMINMSDLYNHPDYNAALALFNTSTEQRRWSIFKAVHLKVTKNKCPICECRLDRTITRDGNHNKKIIITATIDHYRPKKNTLYPFLEFHDKNYILMCSDCNNLYKGCHFPLYTPAIRGTCVNTIPTEKPLIVNPIIDDLADLFNIQLIMSTTGRKLLELTPKHNHGYEYEKALKTIEMFGIGHYDTFAHTNINAKALRLEIMSSHYNKFNRLIKAIIKKDKREMFLELTSNGLDEYGFIEILKKNQCSDQT